MPANRSRLFALGLLPLALVFFVFVYQPPRSVMLEIGSAQADKFLDNFYAIERGFRWSEDRSAVWLSGLGGGNLPWTVGVRLSGSRPAQTPAPHVTLRVNGETVMEFDAANEERDYTVTLPPGRLGLNGDLLLEIDSGTFTPRGDPRNLGVRVLRVWATPGDGFALPSLKIFGFALGLALAVGVAVNPGAISARPGRRRAASPLPAGERSGLSTLLILLALALLAAAGLVAVDSPDAAWWLGIICLSALFLAALCVALTALVPHSLLDKQAWRTWLILLALGVVVRLALDLGRGYEGDVAIYLSLAWKTVSLGLHTAYLNVGDVPPPNTPPFLLYPFWALGRLYQQLFAPLFLPTWLDDPPILRFMLRLPALAADLICAALVVRVTASRGARAALVAAAFYLLNPALIFDSAYWGQTAALHTLWMLLAVIAASGSAYGWAGAALALGVLTKPQALAIAPPVLFLAWRERGLIRLAAASALTWLVVDLPFIVTGNTASVLLQYVQTADYHPYISVNAHNFWWLVTGGQGWQPDSLSLGPLTYRLGGGILFGAATLLAIAVLWRDRKSLYAVAAFQSAAFFMLLTQIHENHILPMFAPLAIAVVLDRQRWWLYAAFALTALANMALHDPNLVMALGYPAEEIYGGPGLALPRWINAAVQCGLFVIFAGQLAARAWPIAAIISRKDAKAQSLR